MVNGVHGNTSDVRPAFTSGFLFKIGSASLQHGFIDSSTSGDDTNHGSSVTAVGFSGSWGKTNSGLASVFGVTDDGSVASSGSANGSLVTGAFFNVGDESTFGDVFNGEDVSDGEWSYMINVEKENFKFLL